MRPNRLRQEAASRAAHRIVNLLDLPERRWEGGRPIAAEVADLIEEEFDAAVAGCTPSDFDEGRLPEILAGDGDWFDPCLLRLIQKADNDNRDRLRLAFPAHVEMYERQTRRPA